MEVFRTEQVLAGLLADWVQLRQRSDDNGFVTFNNAGLLLGNLIQCVSEKLLVIEKLLAIILN
jgi:hypothetical protein